MPSTRQREERCFPRLESEPFRDIVSDRGLASMELSSRNRPDVNGINPRSRLSNRAVRVRNAARSFPGNELLRRRLGVVVWESVTARSRTTRAGEMATRWLRSAGEPAWGFGNKRGLGGSFRVLSFRRLSFPQSDGTRCGWC